VHRFLRVIEVHAVFCGLRFGIRDDAETFLIIGLCAGDENVLRFPRHVVIKYRSEEPPFLMGALLAFQKFWCLNEQLPQPLFVEIISPCLRCSD